MFKCPNTFDQDCSKKMVLIPEEAIQRYEQRQRLETSPLMGTMMHKDTQISDILQRDDVPDDEKQKLFNAYFERFLELRRQKETPTPVKKEEQRVEQQLPDADVVGPIPITMRPRATALLSRLKAKPDVITWDKTGQVKIEGETIPGSNISKGRKKGYGECEIVLILEQNIRVFPGLHKLTPRLTFGIIYFL